MRGFIANADNLPPGCSSNDIPGNSKADMDYNEWYENTMILEAVVRDFIDKNFSLVEGMIHNTTEFENFMQQRYAERGEG